MEPRDFQLKKYSIPAGRYANALKAGEQACRERSRTGAVLAGGEKSRFDGRETG